MQQKTKENDNFSYKNFEREGERDNLKPGTWAMESK
jgi:hypothetical protein